MLINYKTLDFKQLIDTTASRYSISKLRHIIAHMVVLLARTGNLDILHRFANDTAQITQLNLPILLVWAKDKILNNLQFNILPLKKCHENGFEYGLRCHESNLFYKLIYQILRKELYSYTNNKNTNTQSQSLASNSDNHGSNFQYNFVTAQRVYVAALLLWYSQSTVDINSHHCHECNKSCMDHLIEFECKNIEQTKAFKDIFKSKIEQIFKLYLPPKIDIINTLDDETFGNFFIQATQMIPTLNILFSQYLFNRAYLSLFGATAMTQGRKNDQDSALETQLNNLLVHPKCVFHCPIASQSNSSQSELTLVNELISKCSAIGTAINNGLLINCRPKNDLHSQIYKISMTRNEIQESKTWFIPFDQFINQRNCNNRIFSNSNGNILFVYKVELVLHFAHSYQIPKENIISCSGHLFIPIESIAKSDHDRKKAKTQSVCTYNEMWLPIPDVIYVRNEAQFTWELPLSYSLNYVLDDAKFLTNIEIKKGCTIYRMDCNVSWQMIKSSDDVTIETNWSSESKSHRGFKELFATNTRDKKAKEASVKVSFAVDGLANFPTQ